MITSKQTKNLYYLDRDSHIAELVEEIIQNKRREVTTFLERKKNDLESKDPGEFWTIEDTTKCKDGGLEKMMFFFRAAVVPYFVRQENNFWESKIPVELLVKGADEMKRSIGFTLYNLEGQKTEEPNSMTVFKTIKELQEFLTDLENVCFLDRDFFFPDSKHFNELIEMKGREATKTQVLGELHEKFKNKFQDREVTQ